MVCVWARISPKENRWICVIVEHVWTVGLHRYFQLPLHILSTNSVSYFSSFTGRYLPLFCRSSLWTSTTRSHYGLFFCFFLFLYIFLKKLYNTVILTLCQCSSLLLSVQFIFSVVPPSPLLGLFSSYWLFYLCLWTRLYFQYTVFSWLSWGLSMAFFHCSLLS